MPGLRKIPPAGEYTREISDAINGHINRHNDSLMFWLSEPRPAGETYNKNDTVKDGEWTMIANKDTTDRPAPQPIGLPRYASALGDLPPGFATPVEETANISITGQRYSFTTALYILGWRIWIPVAEPTQFYELWLIEDPTGALGIPQFTQLMSATAFASTNWIEIIQGVSFGRPGDEFDLLIVSNSDGAPTTDSGPWNYRAINPAPAAGEITHNNNNVTMRINYVDDNATSHITYLQAMTPGDKVDFGGLTWTITAVVINASDVQLTVTPAVRVPESLYTVSFAQLEPEFCPSVNITDHYVSNPNIQGLHGLDSLDNLVLDQDAYGVDLLVQDANISDDWDLVAFNG